MQDKMKHGPVTIHASLLQVMLPRTGSLFSQPSPGPHLNRECLPLVIIIRNRLKYALTMSEANMICMQKLIKVDGKIRTDVNFPAGFMGM